MLPPRPVGPRGQQRGRYIRGSSALRPLRQRQEGPLRHRARTRANHEGNLSIQNEFITVKKTLQFELRSLELITT